MSSKPRNTTHPKEPSGGAPAPASTPNAAPTTPSTSASASASPSLFTTRSSRTSTGTPSTPSAISSADVLPPMPKPKYPNETWSAWKGYLGDEKPDYEFIEYKKRVVGGAPGQNQAPAPVSAQAQGQALDRGKTNGDHPGLVKSNSDPTGFGLKARMKQAGKSIWTDRGGAKK